MGCGSSNIPIEDEIKKFLEEYHIKPNGFIPNHNQDVQETAAYYIEILDSIDKPENNGLRERLGDITGKSFN